MKKTLTSGIVCLLMAIGAMVVSGCNRYQAFYSPTAKYTPENTADFKRGKRMAKGSHRGPVIFFIPIGSKSPTIALGDAINRYYRPAVALENITIYPRYTPPFIFGGHGYVVHATAILEPWGDREDD